MKDPDKMPTPHGWSHEFLSTADIDAVETEYEVLHLMRRCATHFGFSHFLVARFPASDQQRFSERLVISNWPAELVRKYDSLGLFHVSRLAAEVARTKRPVHGDNSFLAPKDWEDEKGQEAIALADAHGLARSTAFLLHTTAGEPFVCLFSGSRDPMERGELAEFYFGCVQLFECLEKTFSAGVVTGEKLSSREIECLRWAAAGKSSDEIAIILGISVYTVSSYFKSATRKLQAVNRMQAIACAMRLKLI